MQYTINLRHTIPSKKSDKMPLRVIDSFVVLFALFFWVAMIFS